MDEHASNQPTTSGWPASVTALEARLRGSPFEVCSAELIAQVRPAIQLRPMLEGPVGRSRFGGLPDVGPGFRWPRARRPLTFLLQLDLSEIAGMPAAAPLPPSGLLSFFYNLIDQPWGHRRIERTQWRVLFTPGEQPLRRVPKPPGALADTAILREVGLRLEPVVTLPNNLRISRQAAEELHAQAGCPACAFEAMVLPSDAGPVHQVFGYDRPVQTDDYGTASDPESPWVSLLQLDSDPCLGLAFGDAGKLHWRIHIDDLVLREFSEVRGTLQCY